MKTINFPNAVLLGSRQHLAQAYPIALREELGRKVRLLPETVSGSEWKNHTAALAEADVLFATWGMPKLDEEFLAAAPRLKAVFYAAGSVKCFATPESYKRGILISSAWQAPGRRMPFLWPSIPTLQFFLGSRASGQANASPGLANSVINIPLWQAHSTRM